MSSPGEWIKKVELECVPLDNKGRPELGGGILEYHKLAYTLCQAGVEPSAAARKLIKAGVAVASSAGERGFS